MSACKCNVSLSNTGKSSCEPIANVIKKIIIVNIYDSTGAKNFVDTTATFNAAYFTGKLNETDASKRWFPTPSILNVTSAKADSVFETFADTSKIFIHEGVRSFEGVMPNLSPAYLGKLKSVRCAEVGIYIVDKDGSLIGATTEAGKLYPIALDTPSWNPTLIFGTDTEKQKINLKFDFSVDASDEDIRMILADDMASGVSLVNLNGLIDAYVTYSSISLTSFTAKLYTSFGSVVNPITVKGLLQADFTLFKGLVSVPILTFSENMGVYTFTFAAQLTGSEITVTPTKTGYDFSQVVANKVTLVP